MNAEQSCRIEELYLDMFEKLKIYAYCSLESDALAEEAVQETFRIACQKPEQLCASSNPRGWLVQTLKYTIHSIQNDRTLTQKLIEKYLAQVKDISFAEDSLDLRILYENVSDLKEFKLLVEMAVDGQSYLEMAASRGISVSACKKRVERAKKILRKKLKK